MKRRTIRFGFACALGYGLLALAPGVFGADDTKTTAKDTPAKLPDYSKYTFEKEITGEVVKADDKSLTIKIKYTAFKPQPNPRVPPMYEEKTKDFEYAFIPESLVRTKVLPPKVDSNGKKVPYTDKEKAALKVPPEVSGYAAAKSDLTAGATVNVILIREKSLSASKVTDADLKIKFAIIQPPPATTSTDPVKKN